MTPVMVNGKRYTLQAPAETPLLWALREELELTGTKFGCGQARCGACTVLLGGSPIRSCVTPISRAAGKEVTTIEGLPEDDPVRRAWEEEQVPQCGYCQSGQIIAAVALLRKVPKPTDDAISRALAGNVCRCGTYLRIRAAVHRAAGGG